MQHKSDLRSWVAVIPIRKGSKGLLDKNIRDLNGKPLYMHTVDQALAAGAAKIILSTNIAEVIDSVHDPRVTILVRPEELCGDDIQMAPVLAHAINASNLQGTIALMQATSPLRSVVNIDKALSIWWGGAYDMVMSVSKADKSALKYGLLSGDEFLPLSNPDFCFSNRQSLPDIYRPNGAIYLIDAKKFINFNKFSYGRIGTMKMSKMESIDIDSIDDFNKCEEILAAQREC
ncbi:acylneuraminate cytidylyltransferase family protein [Polynucleobacter paneuropaeus]|nr:acylneuraminate cytidylyltransferase family protein [Polynucleobacter paneuropaeus]